MRKNFCHDAANRFGRIHIKRDHVTGPVFDEDLHFMYYERQTTTIFSLEDFKCDVSVRVVTFWFSATR